MSRCPRCNCEAAGQNRLVTDSCGHSKCRQCLLADISDCLECKLAPEVAIVAVAVTPSQEEPVVTPSGSHITSTSHGYHCTVCNKSFRSRTQQYYHRACGNELLKKFNCSQCSRRFASRSHLKYHLNSHGNNPSYSCNTCGKAFKQQLVLKRHMRVHKPDEFACLQCKRLFRSQTTLAAHTLVHSGNSLPHKCDTCSKCYLTKANLRQHRLKHDQNSARHSCPVCQKSFLRQSTLRLHQLRHSKRVRHACLQCHKSFNDADALTRHRKQHVATQSYRCKQCEVSVNRKDNMLRHLRAMHPGIDFDVGVEILAAEPKDIPVSPAPVEASAQNQRYNSVIKSIGNVEPVRVPLPQPEAQLEPPTNAATSMQKENVKLYRKIILDLDNEEYSNELSNVLDMDDPAAAINVQEVTCHAQPQNQHAPASHSSSNFIERHWRKTFKYSYENGHTN